MSAYRFGSVAAALCVAVVCLGCGKGERTDEQDAGAEPDPCEQLVFSTCGGDPAQSPECLHTSSCEAARLTQKHEQESCRARLSQQDVYVPCGRAAGGGTLSPPVNDAASACPDLLEQACGPGGAQGACASSEPCSLATDVAAQGDSAACREAVGDKTAFPRCGGM